VLSIDEKARTLTTSKKPWQYTKLLLATGTQPIQLPVFAEVKDLYYFHTADDLNTLLELLQTPNNQHIAVIGAGLSGLEATDALRYHQTQVSIFNRGTGVLSRHVPRDGQDYLHHILKRNQVATYFEQTIQSINLKTDGTYSVLTTNGTTIHDITAFLCTLGTTACAHSFIDSTSIRHEQGFIIVDDNMRTSTDHIYAAGDAIITKNKISGQPCRSTLWPDAVQQAITAAHHMVGKEKPYAGTIPLVSSSFFATRFISCGYVQDPLVNHITSTISDAGYQAYCYNQNNELIGFVLIGDTSMLPAARAQLKKTSA
jgi:NAD(P)H-nitrite reductase large subunit